MYKQQSTSNYGNEDEAKLSVCLSYTKVMRNFANATSYIDCGWLTDFRVSNDQLCFGMFCA